MNQEHPSPPRPTLTDQLRARTRFIIDPVVEKLAQFKLSHDLRTVVGALTQILFAYLIAIGEFRSESTALPRFLDPRSRDGWPARTDRPTKRGGL